MRERAMGKRIMDAGGYRKVFYSGAIHSGREMNRPFTIHNDPIMTSAALYKDFTKLTDDASVVSVKINV